MRCQEGFVKKVRKKKGNGVVFKVKDLLKEDKKKVIKEFLFNKYGK